jgi:hypothetical protein
LTNCPLPFVTFGTIEQVAGGTSGGSGFGVAVGDGFGLALGPGVGTGVGATVGTGDGVGSMSSIAGSPQAARVSARIRTRLITPPPP